MKCICKNLHPPGCFSHAGISSTADVQGSVLCPGSTPGATLLYEREVSLRDRKTEKVLR